MSDKLRKTAARWGGRGVYPVDIFVIASGEIAIKALSLSATPERLVRNSIAGSYTFNILRIFEGPTRLL